MLATATVCAWCGLPPRVGEPLTADHLLPLAHGGGYEGNLVAAHRAELDDAIAAYAEGWTLDRMPSVDRNVLRLATYEILHVDDVPDAVAVSEALELVRELSTDDSPAFVNGVLGAIVRNKATISDTITRDS